jgi:hypothetical protein
MLDNPAVQAAVQGGIAPFVAALIVAVALGRTRFAWLAIVAGYATQVALATGFTFTPLTASRNKILLLCLLAPVIGIVADLAAAQARSAVYALSALAGAAAVWAFVTLLAQKEGAQMWLAGADVFAFAAVMGYLLLSLRDDPLRTGAAGVGLGLATGIVSLMSASVGLMTSGVSIAAASGALLLVYMITAKPAPPGWLGTLSIGLSIALFAEGSLMLAQLPWYALVLLLAVPLAVRLPVNPSAPVFVRVVVLSLYAIVAAMLPIAAVWFWPGG